jgi:hypothetical protein
VRGFITGLVRRACCLLPNRPRVTVSLMRTVARGSRAAHRREGPYLEAGRSNPARGNPRPQDLRLYRLHAWIVALSMPLIEGLAHDHAYDCCRLRGDDLRRAAGARGRVGARNAECLLECMRLRFPVPRFLPHRFVQPSERLQETGPGHGEGLPEDVRQLPEIEPQQEVIFAGPGTRLSPGKGEAFEGRHPDQRPVIPDPKRPLPTPQASDRPRPPRKSAGERPRTRFPGSGGIP